MGAITLYDRLAAQLDGHTATVESLSESAVEPESADDVVTAYGLSPGGSWVRSDDDCGLDGFLDDLLAKYNCALLSGFPDARVSTVALVGVDVVNVVAEAEMADAADVVSLATEINSHESHVTLEAPVEHAKADPLGAYADTIAAFTRRARAKESEDDDSALSLEFEKYDGVAESKIGAISGKLGARDGVLRVLIHHRVGIVEDGADTVSAVVLTGHRREAFRMVEDGIGRLKDEIPIFKKEATTDEEFQVYGR